MSDIREIDFTRTFWGHNLDILSWDRQQRRGRAVCWVTPGLKEGDVLIVNSEQGQMKLKTVSVKKSPNVDDMYNFDVIPYDDSEAWVVKVRRHGGGTSVIDICSSREKAEALAQEFNAQYHTDTYYVEPHKES